ncbi:MAG TPA: hypothetical protein VN578_08460 [Candidatus Binatia bacterium]|jgi:hypothetical protein|nr:hypothetical protein [Candidatus Binatia bacterium]
MKSFSRWHPAGLTALLIFCLGPVSAQIVFTDNFDAGASPLWSNLRGNWASSGGVYYATQPNNIPATFTGLPFVLQNFAIDVDINQVADGGIWLRSDASGTNGVLLVTGGYGWGSGNRGPNAGRSLYWHVITDANYNNPPILNPVFNVFTNPGVQNVHLRIEVVDNQYSAFVNGSTNATTSLLETNRTYSSGHVGLYDFSSQTFDNFVLQIPPGFGPYSLAITSGSPQRVTLLWTTNAVGWALESAVSPVGSIWNSVTNAPLSAGTNFAVTVPSTSSQQLFRLRKQ